MNNLILPSIAPDLATQRPTRPVRNPQMNAIAFSMSEVDAVERAKQGDGASFEALYGRHKRRVYALCLRMTGNEAEAEDLTQEAFLQVYRKIVAFRGQSAFSTWLHRVAVNVVLSRVRKKGLLEVSLQEPLDPEERDGPKRDFGIRDSVLAESIDRINLERAMEHLSSGCRNVFVLFDIEGYGHSEIAGMMGCSIGNTKAQLHKARMKLRLILKTGKAEMASRDCHRIYSLGE